MIPVKTLTKVEMLALLASLKDEDRIYVHMRIDDADIAINSARQGHHDELFFGLTGDTVREADGISIIATLPKLGISS